MFCKMHAVSVPALLLTHAWSLFSGANVLPGCRGISAGVCAGHDRLRADIDWAKREGLTFGAKLVRCRRADLHLPPPHAARTSAPCVAYTPISTD